MKNENPYEIYFLSENPFPIVPIPKEFPQIFGANHEGFERINWQLNKITKNNRPIHVVLVGPYGSGKTHLLRYLSSKINEQIEGGLGAYVPHPGPDFISIYRRFIESLRYDRILDLSKSADERKLKKTIIYHDFVTALVNLRDEKNTLIAWRWLTGNTLTLEERRTLNVATSIERTEDALNAFSALLNFLRNVGFKLICMIIDEFEEINALVPLQKRRLFNDLRHLIDLNVSNFSLIIACTPHGWEAIYEENAALVRRFSSNIVFIEPLDNTATSKLVSEYLRDFRINNLEFQNYFKKLKGNKKFIELYPFTENAIEELRVLSKGNAGEILKYCSITIEQGVKKKINVVNADTLHSLIAEYYGKSEEMFHK